MGKPLAVRWLAHELPELHAGTLATARAQLENAGVTAWRGGRFTVSYHWLDELGNAIVRLIESETLRKRLGARAREVAAREHTWIHNAQRVLAAYQDLTG